MAYNKTLANRIREALSTSSVTEQEKMGGVSFMVNGAMLVRAHSDGNMMLRCKPELTDTLLLKKGASRFTMKGKAMMKGWLLISADAIKSKKDFDYWISVALTWNEK